jgi:hypothetical protein
MINITTQAIFLLRQRIDATIYIKEEAKDLIVDVAESQMEAYSKCDTASKMTGAQFKYYLTSKATMDSIRKATKDVDISQKPAQGFNKKSNLYPKFGPNERGKLVYASDLA